MCNYTRTIYNTKPYLLFINNIFQKNRIIIIVYILFLSNINIRKYKNYKLFYFMKKNIKTHYYAK